MSHHETGMAGMENPAKSFGEGIRRIDDAGEMAKDEIAKSMPLLKGKVTDVNMARSFGGPVVVDNLDGGIIVNPNWCGIRLSVPKVMKNRSKILDDFSNGGTGDEFRFSRTGGCERLCLGAISDDTSSKGTTITSSRPECKLVIIVGSINKCYELLVGVGSGNCGKRGIWNHEDDINFRKVKIGR